MKNSGQPVPGGFFSVAVDFYDGYRFTGSPIYDRVWQLFYKKAPDKINGLFGCCPAMSMKNRSTWQFAHHTCGRLWRVPCILLLDGFAIAMLFLLGSTLETIAIVATCVLFFQIFFLLGTIFPVERAEKKLR